MIFIFLMKNDNLSIISKTFHKVFRKITKKKYFYFLKNHHIYLSYIIYIFIIYLAL